MKVQKYLPPQQKPAPEKQLQDVANMYEKHFLREMVKSMRSTVQESGFIQTNHAEKIFRGQLDEEYVDKWGEKGGIGLSKLIYDQLIEKFGAQLGIKSPQSPIKGPIELKIQDTTSRRAEQASSQQTTTGLGAGNPVSDKQTYQLTLPAGGEASDRQVQSPWEGQLTKKIELRPDEHLLEIAHRNGLKSQLYYQGRVSQIEIGKQIQSGENLGLLSPDSNKLLWSISQEQASEKLGQTGLISSDLVSE